MELDLTLIPRPDLAPDWCEVLLPDDLFLYSDCPAGTWINVGHLELVTLENAKPGFPVMCRIGQDKRQRAKALIFKYAEEPTPSLIKRAAQWFRRRIKRDR